MISNAQSTTVSSQSSGQLDPATLLPEYMFANTPAYLFDRMRALPAVRGLAERSNSDELVRLVEEIDSSRKTPTGVALAYAYTTALSFRPQSEVVEALSGKKIENLAWFRPLIALGFAATKNASPTIFTFEQKGSALPSNVAEAPFPSARNSVTIEIGR